MRRRGWYWSGSELGQAGWEHGNKRFYEGWGILLLAKKLLAFGERSCSMVGLLIVCESFKAFLDLPLPCMDSLLPCHNFWAREISLAPVNLPCWDNATVFYVVGRKWMKNNWLSCYWWRFQVFRTRHYKPVNKATQQCDVNTCQSDSVFSS
jgi:hypothetical protein